MLVFAVETAFKSLRRLAVSEKSKAAPIAVVFNRLGTSPRAIYFPLGLPPINARTLYKPSPRPPDGPPRRVQQGLGQSRDRCFLVLLPQLSSPSLRRCCLGQNSSCAQDIASRGLSVTDSRSLAQTRRCPSSSMHSSSAVLPPFLGRLQLPFDLFVSRRSRKPLPHRAP